MPMFLSGQSKVAEQFVKQNVKVFEDANVDIVITMCSSCIAAWRKYVPKVAEQILGRQPKFEVLDIHDFLVNKVSLDARGMVQITDKVTYHDPCHLKRGAGIYKEPRMLIKMIPGIEFVEMREADKCCGGFLRFNEPQLANRIGEVKGELIRDSEANTVTTACPLCVSQLRIITKKIGLQNIEVLNVIELLERAYLVNK
jgi:Fe-S oxidoreductase